MPPNTLRVHMEYVLVKSVGPKVLRAESRVQGTGEYFPPLQFHPKIMEVEIGGVAIYRPFEEFRRANSYCHLYGAQGLSQRQTYFQPLAAGGISNSKNDMDAAKGQMTPGVRANLSKMAVICLPGNSSSRHSNILTSKLRTFCQPMSTST
ncbi:uncharacterized protein TNCV_602661 [Trichonephila clavipes]|nr:uncharacterized protein TNCV_602661 [Trichonephila clavipes]